MTASRDAILFRLRAARGPGTARKPTPPKEAPRFRDATLFRDGTEDAEQLVSLFGERLRELNGELHSAPDRHDAGNRLNELLETLSGGRAAFRCALHSFPLLDSIQRAAPALAVRLRRCGVPVATARDVLACDVAITAADHLIARTGSLLLRTTTCGGRQLSVLAPVHIVVAGTSQLLPSLEDGLRWLAEDTQCSFATWISGPSRTADIEKILVLGAHGPRRLIVVLIAEA